LALKAISKENSPKLSTVLLESTDTYENLIIDNTVIRTIVPSWELYEFGILSTASGLPRKNSLPQIKLGGGSNYATPRNSARSPGSNQNSNTPTNNNIDTINDPDF
jgi:hypothetical protein